MDTTLNVVIVDDEENARQSLQNIIEKNCDKNIHIKTAENVEKAVSLLNKNNCDILFLDINLEDGTGFDILNRIDHRKIKIIFTTAYNEYAIRAIKLSAVDYLLKPLNSEEVISALKRAKELTLNEQEQFKISTLINNFTQNGQKIVLKTADSIYIVNIQNIIYCESDNSYTTFFLADTQKITVSRTLKEFESLLDSFGFLRIHRSYLININYILRYNKTKNVIEMQNHTLLTVSQRKKEDLFAMLNKLPKM